MVIQRIQTIYLLVAAILMTVFAFVPFMTGGDATLSVASFAHSNLELFAVLLLFNALAVLLPLLAIFMYKNLKAQSRISGIAIFTTITLVALVLITKNSLEILDGGKDIHYTWWLVLPLLAMVACVMAIRGIKRDRKLLSDSARIR